MPKQDIETMLHHECLWVQEELRKFGVIGAQISVTRKSRPAKREVIELVAELPQLPSKRFGSGFVSLVTLQTHGQRAAREAATELLQQVTEELGT